MGVIDNAAESTQDSAEWIFDKVLVVLGAGTPREQMGWSLLLAAGAWISTAITTGLTIFAALFFTATFLIGAARLLVAQVMG